MRKLSATLAAAVVTTAISGAVFAQSGAYPLHVTEQAYVLSRRTLPRDYAGDPNLPSRRIYMEEAGRRSDAMVQSRPLTPYEADRLYGHPIPQRTATLTTTRGPACLQAASRRIRTRTTTRPVSTIRTQ